MACNCRGGSSCCMLNKYDYVKEAPRTKEDFSWLYKDKITIGTKRRKNIKYH